MTKIKFDSLVQQGNPFKESIEGAKELLETLVKLRTEAVEVGKDISKSLKSKSIPQNAEQLKVLNTSLNDLKTTTESISEIDKQKLKLEQKLKTLNSDKIQDNEELKVQIQEQNKINKQLAKEKLKLVGAYEKESKRLVKLRKDYKNLVLAEGKTTKASSKLLKEIKKLDRELKDVDESTGQFQRSVGEYPKVLSDSTKKLLGLAAGLFAVKGASDSVKSSLEGSEEGSEDLRKVTAGANAVLGQTKNVLAATALDLFDFGKELFSGEKKLSEITKAFDRTSKATDNFSQKVKDNIAIEVEAEEATINLEKAIRPLEIRFAVLTGLIDKQVSIAGDSTRSFNEIEEAANKANKLQIERANITLKIANEELRIIQLKRKQREESGLNVLDLLDAEKEAEIKLQDARNGLLVEQLDNDKTLRENARDRFERELDFAIDAFDSQKTVNERRIADDQISFDKRKKLLEETINLTNSSFDSQIKLVEDYTKQKIDFDELSKESDEAVIRAKLRTFNFDDVTLGRVLEIIKERKLALQDLSDAQRDVNDSEQEAIDLREKIIDQETALKESSVESSKQYDEDIIENEIEALRRRLELYEKGSIAYLNIQSELNEKLLEQQTTQLEKEKENQKELEDAIKETTQVIAESYIKRLEEKQKTLDEELQSSKQHESDLKELAKDGVQDANDNLAFEQRKQAEIDKKKAQALKNQKRVELGLVALQTFGNLTQSGEKQPLGKTITEVTKLLAFINSLPAFKDGVIDFQGTGTETSDSNLVRLSKHESVIKAKASKKYTSELGAMNNMTYNPLDFVGVPKTVDQPRYSQDNTAVINKLDMVEKAIRQNPSQLIDYNKIKDIVIEKIKKGNTVHTNHYKDKSLF